MESLLRVSEIHEKYLKDKINLIELYRVANNVPANKYRLIKDIKHYELEAFLKAFQEHEKKKRHKWRKYEGR